MRHNVFVILLTCATVLSKSVRLIALEQDIRSKGVEQVDFTTTVLEKVQRAVWIKMAPSVM